MSDFATGIVILADLFLPEIFHSNVIPPPDQIGGDGEMTRNDRTHGP
jgi:hypothetical protein